MIFFSYFLLSFSSTFKLPIFSNFEIRNVYDSCIFKNCTAVDSSCVGQQLLCNFHNKLDSFFFVSPNGIKVFSSTLISLANSGCRECLNKIVLKALLTPIFYLRLKSKFFKSPQQNQLETREFFIPFFRRFCISQCHPSCKVNKLLVINPQDFQPYLLIFEEKHIVYQQVHQLPSDVTGRTECFSFIENLLKEKKDLVLKITQPSFRELIEMKFKREGTLTSFLSDSPQLPHTAMERKRLSIFSCYVTFADFSQKFMQQLSLFSERFPDGRPFVEELKKTCLSGYEEYKELNKKLPLASKTVEKNPVVIFYKATDFPYLKLLLWSIPFNLSNFIQAYNRLMDCSLEESLVFSVPEKAPLQLQSVSKEKVFIKLGYNTLYTFMNAYCEPQLVPSFVKYERLNSKPVVHRELKGNKKGEFVISKIVLIFIITLLIVTILLYKGFIYLIKEKL